jgi:DNA-binding MarR family transcriptional regulator
MMKNSIDNAGILAISTRLQRLSEQIRKDGFLVYKAYDIYFEPKWFPVIYTLHFKKILSVLDLSNEIGYTHPSTITLLNELEKEKLVRSKSDKQDARKRLVQLTKKGEKLVEQMQPVWQTLIATAAELTGTSNNIMNSITEVENLLKQKSFAERAKKYMEPKELKE